MVSVVESEEAAQIAVVGAQSALDVGQQSAVVLALQLHVHDVVLLRCFLALPFTLFRRLVVDLHILHRVVRQVVEHHLVVALEKVLAVERQVVHLLAVDVDVAVVLQLGARHLAHQSVEHGTLGQVERCGVVDHRIAAIGNFYFRARDDHPLEVALGEDVVLLSFLLQQYARHLEQAVAGDVLHVVVDVARVVAVALGLDDEVVLLAWYLELVVGVARTPRPHVARRGVDDGGVAAHECHVSL